MATWKVRSMLSEHRGKALAKARGRKVCGRHSQGLSRRSADYSSKARMSAGKIKSKGQKERQSCKPLDHVEALERDAVEKKRMGMGEGGIDIEVRIHAHVVLQMQPSGDSPQGVECIV